MRKLQHASAAHEILIVAVAIGLAVVIVIVIGILKHPFFVVFFHIVIVSCVQLCECISAWFLCAVQTKIIRSKENKQKAQQSNTTTTTTTTTATPMCVHY